MISDLTSFARGGFATAAAVIGSTTIAIAGGTEVACVTREVDHAHTLEEGGYAGDAVLAVVCDASAFDAAYTDAAETYLDELATVAGESYRVESIGLGDATTTINLRHPES